ncbi:hypothetical protein [Saccharomonospora iraqiensis]|uniref:hypothetical protein n=1 Tax=Saccharomonospora iraqiensis TaxID=52698 RepID=UPI0003F903D9|nr:hypothetical protein [Saccharomonospora iraqiensis]
MTEPPESDDQRRKRGLPPEPAVPGEKRDDAAVPGPVTAGFWLYVLAGLVLVAAVVLTFPQRESLVDSLLEMDVEGLTREQAEASVTNFLWLLLLGALALAGFTWLFAYKARQGTRSARTVLTVLAVVFLLVALLLPGLMAIGAAFAAALATILLHLPSVADYFPQVGRSLH